MVVATTHHGLHEGLRPVDAGRRLRLLRLRPGHLRADLPPGARRRPAAAWPWRWPSGSGLRPSTSWPTRARVSTAKEAQAEALLKQLEADQAPPATRPGAAGPRAGRAARRAHRASATSSGRSPLRTRSEVESFRASWTAAASCSRGRPRTRSPPPSARSRSTRRRVRRRRPPARHAGASRGRHPGGARPGAGAPRTRRRPRARRRRPRPRRRRWRSATRAVRSLGRRGRGDGAVQRGRGRAGRGRQAPARAARRARARWPAGARRRTVAACVGVVPGPAASRARRDQPGRPHRGRGAARGRQAARRRGPLGPHGSCASSTASARGACARRWRGFLDGHPHVASFRLAAPRGRRRRHGRGAEGLGMALPR